MDDFVVIRLGPAPLKVIVKKLSESFLPGAARPHIAAGWYWYYAVVAPGNVELVGTIKGPFESKDFAVNAYRRHASTLSKKAKT